MNLKLLFLTCFLISFVSAEGFLEKMEERIEDTVDAMTKDIPIIQRVEEGDKIIKADKNDLFNTKYMDSEHMPDLYSILPANYTGPITIEVFPKLSQARIEREIYIREQKKLYKWDNTFGPLHRAPYAGGSLFPKYETLTIKPGFKIWVDGGTIDYYQELCYAKKLNCSATCCKQSYCAPTMSDCINYKRKTYSDIYIGVLVMVMITFGIPTCILTCELFLNQKFCRIYHEDADVWIGGYTITEMITYALTLGKSAQISVREKDCYTYEHIKETAEEQQLYDEMTRNRYIFAPTPVVKSKYSAVDQWTTPTKEDVNEAKAGTEEVKAEADLEEKPLISNQAPEEFPKLMIPKRRNCCMRIICLMCCCNTRDIGTLANVKMTEQELAAMQVDLMREIERRNSLRGNNNSLLSLKDEGNVTAGAAGESAAAGPTATPDKKEGPPSEEAKTQV